LAKLTLSEPGIQNKILVSELFLELLAFSLYRYLKLAHKLKTTPKEKGNAIPLQAWTGPEDSRRLRLPDFKIIGK